MKWLKRQSGSSFVRLGTSYFGMPATGEFLLAVALISILLVLKIANLLHQRFDSDEPQHLHVIWSWTQGLIQYRDVFDNHMPLFHIALAPVVGLIGERPTILYWMRFVLLPFYFVSMGATYRIGTQLFSMRVGVWSVIALSFYPGYQSNASEFRPDNVWAPLWLLCLIVLLGGAISFRRILIAGLLLGFCFGVSMKSTVLLISLLLSAPLALVLTGREKLNLPTVRLIGYAATFLTATALIPLTIMIFLSLKGIWSDFLYCVFEHQFFGHLYRQKQVVFVVAFLVLFPVVIYMARWVLTSSADFQLGFRRAFVVLVTCSYFLALRAFWPLIARGDYLPFYPLVFVLLTGALFAFTEQLSRSVWRVGRIFQFLPLPGFVAIIEFFLLLETRPFWKDKTRDETNMLRDILTLTTPRDYVFDCKGETIFRRRPFLPVLETITRERIRRGLMTDNAPQLCVETCTCVAATIMIERLSPSTREFMERNYLPVTENLRVAGLILTSSYENPGQYNFEVVIPADYEIIARDGIVSGTLDGSAYQAARFLSAGPHTFDSTSTSRPLICVWAQAADRNFTPFLPNISFRR
jgi:hypothetical protein